MTCEQELELEPELESNNMIIIIKQSMALEAPVAPLIASKTVAQGLSKAILFKPAKKWPQGRPPKPKSSTKLSSLLAFISYLGSFTRRLTGIQQTLIGDIFSN